VGYNRRTQKDYSISFKLQLVFEEIWARTSYPKLKPRPNMVFKEDCNGDQHGLKKYGTLIGNIDLIMAMAKHLKKKYFELEAKVTNCSKKQKSSADTLPSEADKKASSSICSLIWQKKSMNIQNSEKNYTPGLSTTTRKIQRNVSFYLWFTRGEQTGLLQIESNQGPTSNLLPKRL